MPDEKADEMIDTADTSLVDNTTLQQLSKAEIDTQIETAKRFPRSLKRFRDEALQMATLTETIAQECLYALPREGKTIEGPSARFAEIVASAWGNCRAGARVISEGAEFVTAQGVFHDLERNVAITYEVQRRIVDRKGRRFGVDMVGVTANAACSIALRNAVLKGVPKAFWSAMYQAARATVRGDFKTLANRRSDALAQFQGFGVTREMVLAKLGLKGVEDIGLDHLVLLQGMLTALKDQETTPEAMFAHSDEAIAEPRERKQSEVATGSGTQPPTNAATQGSAPPSGGESTEPVVAASGQQQGDLPEGTEPAVMRSNRNPVERAKELAEKNVGPKRATKNMIKQVEARLESSGLNVNKMLGAIGAEALDELTVPQVNEALDWIEKNV